MAVVKVETLKNNKKKVTYYYVFEAKDVHGKRVTYKKRGFETKKASEAAEVEAKDKVNKGTFIKSSKVTFTEYLREWLSNR